MTSRRLKEGEIRFDDHDNHFYDNDDPSYDDNDDYNNDKNNGENDMQVLRRKKSGIVS